MIGEKMPDRDDRRHCPDCDRWLDFERRIEGNISTGEEWEILSCPVCGWIDEKKRVRCPVIHVAFEGEVSE